MGTETESHRAVWSNATDCSETGQNCSHPDFQSSQHVKPTVRILHQTLQISEEREPKEKPAETQKEDKPGPPVYGENSGHLWQSGTFFPIILILLTKFA